MITVAEAERIILAHQQDFGAEQVPLSTASGRVLAETIATDRDQPPYNRVTMDGIAIRYADYAAGCRKFKIESTQAAGEVPSAHLPENSCIEIMTGAALPTAADTVIPYENLSIEEGFASLAGNPVRQGQSIHYQGSDRKRGDVVMRPGQAILPPQINMAAAVGKSELLVKKLPRTVILSSGDELVDVWETPSPFQIRRTNVYSTAAVLERFGIAATMLHLPDDPVAMEREIATCLKAFELIILSGGVSMGKFDFVPTVMENLGVKQHFHKVRQRPGKPFWFGTFGHRGVVFALPGNPVSTFLCLHRYVLPWLEASLGLILPPPKIALLESPVTFEPPLQYFIQVTLRQDGEARLWAKPLEGHGSGDFANLLETHAFLELPYDRSEFFAGEVFRVLPFAAM